VIPLLGPSTLRDTAALPVDFQGNLVSQIDDVPVRNTLTVTRLVNSRANLLKQEGLMEGAALDKYTLMRDVYLQYRRNLVYDGNPPEEPMLEEDEPEAEPAK
jgi:phospholipid-binding lipoprotein MlaA